MTTRLRPILAGTLTAVAALVVFVALVVPDHVARLKPGWFVPGAFLRIPLEGIVGAAVLLVVPDRARRAAAALIGLGLGVLTVLKTVNMGFLSVLGRRFDPVLDWPLLGDGYNYLVETSGRPMALAAVAGAVAGVAAVLGVVMWAVGRLAGVAARHHRAATRTVPAAVAAWVAFGWPEPGAGVLTAAVVLPFHIGLVLPTMVTATSRTV